MQPKCVYVVLPQIVNSIIFAGNIPTSVFLNIFLALFLLATLYQIIYLILLLSGFQKPQKKSGAVPDVGVSVIVAAHNERLNLEELLPLLLDQDYPNFEVIVVDDRSDDETHDLLINETSKHHRLKFVRVDQTPVKMDAKKYALTLGIKAAQNDIVLFCDADCRPASNLWIVGMVSSMEESTQFVLGYSPYRKERGFLNLFIRYEAFMTAASYLGWALRGSPYMGVGRNLCYRRSLFLEKKGFNKFIHLTGGDDDLFVNTYATGTNTETCIEPSSHVYSIPKRTWPSFLHQKKRHLIAGKHYQNKHKWLLGSFSVSLIMMWIIGLCIIGYGVVMPFVIGGLFLRLIVLIVAVRGISDKLNTKLELALVPLLDFLYTIYYLSTGLLALTTKRISWTN